MNNGSGPIIFNFNVRGQELVDGRVQLTLRDTDLQTLQGAGYTRADIQSIQLGFVQYYRPLEPELVDAPWVACFVAGTLIATDNGEVPVEQLREGDLVLTKDNGPKPILWIESTTIPIGTGPDSEQLVPVRVNAGSLGCGLPRRDLEVSQQHRIVVKSEIARRMTTTDEVLLPAKKLLACDGIELASERETVTYVHFLFDQHEIVWSNGAETESLFTGPEVLKSVSPEARLEILTLFPDLVEQPTASSAAARKILSGRRAEKLVHRITKNGKHIYSERAA
ncbi:Hint domain-containing protein [Palleronia caenipelagi]|uniref:Hint domain-containing protein n=2 Tax=Palleronia caenipelagi TaxID=2489174 RepID=A0A547PS73_9RHOB|nr:Hint domain-containing protein [Palleronia caenipelagi]